MKNSGQIRENLIKSQLSTGITDPLVPLSPTALSQPQRLLTSSLPWPLRLPDPRPLLGGTFDPPQPF